ncbi:BspA family leucine-rich repeat surface protein [Aquimarina gracilis]|uniref:BspA family leucine-rich repeat surface protein n=2 Tax=Aquimarina gracilis TaxID=874422 RepID=A0ABU6A2G8_9FLAO|nr:BspA family leucine-rich repeat surface protein [Aquimarina gracilis]MEB3348240.1 BspA family leucine-rich repeat surface protein [Aquimarina gracilis]
MQRRAITQDYDHSKLQAMAEDFTATARANKQEALSLAKIHGWEPMKYNADGTFSELMGVRDDGSPIYYTLYNVNAAKSTRTNHLNTGGSLGLDLNGQDMKVYVWDGGPTLPTHQEFNDQANPRVIINDGVTTLNGDSWHAQHVTGTILAAGVQPNAKGMAPLAKAFTHEWNNDRGEATIAAGEGMLLSNHSYGWDPQFLSSWNFGAYEGTARAWDELMYNAPAYLPVFAAGNDGNYTGNDAPLNGNPAFDKLSGWQTAKNHLVVANAHDASVASDGSLINVAINSRSSQGPTDDFRIKPDITGNGTSVYSTHVTSDAGYRFASGTSMAAPNVTGSLLLLQEYYEDENDSFMRAATLKGLALHTADDAGMAGPDAIFGWGLLNAKAAAQEITNNGTTAIIAELTLTPGQSYSLPVEADGVNDLIASISWTDPPGTVTPFNTPNNSTPTLVNDLDIRVTQASSTFFPYRLTGVDTNDQGDNIVDPYERVDVKGASGNYIVTVTHKGSLSGGSQNYSLIVTGVNISCDMAGTPTNLNLGTVGENTATISWDAIPNATYDIRYRKLGSANWTTVSSSNTSFFELNGLEVGTQYEVQVRSKCQDNSVSAYTDSVFFTTEESLSFITFWRTTSVNEEITIPTNNDSGPYSYTVDWGDGTIDPDQTGNATHTYAEAKQYEVKITGNFPHIYFNGREGSDKIQAVAQWGDIQWKSMVGAFKGCTNLEIIATDTPDLSQVEAMSEMFSGATSFNQDIGGWDVSKVINMHGMFHGATAFNQDISNWDVSNVEIMRNMFWKATSFNQDIGRWNVSKVTSITWMFEEATAFNQDINGWNVSNSTSMLGMFKDATAFNQDISRWDMSNVESTASMFEGATSFNQDIRGWEVGNVIYMEDMFKGAISFNQDISRWDMSNVESTASMFEGATSFNQDIGGWNVSDVTNMAGMFNNATNFDQNIGGWDISNVTNMREMLSNSDLSMVNYGATLKGWADLPNTPTGITLGANELVYEQIGAAHRQKLKDVHGWTITGDTREDNNEAPTVVLAPITLTLDENGEVTLLATQLDNGSTDNFTAPENLMFSFDADGNETDRVFDCSDLGDHQVTLYVTDEAKNSASATTIVTVLNSALGENGCGNIANDALRVLVMTPSCTGSADGSVEVIMDIPEYLMDISIEGDTIENRFFQDIASSTNFEIDDLAVGNYTVTVIIPEISFERTFGVTVNEIGSVSGKRESLDLKQGKAKYVVRGSDRYQVSVNGEKMDFAFGDTGLQSIQLENLYGHTDVVISGRNDCQGKVTDSFFMNSVLAEVYPTITSSFITILTHSDSLDVQVYTLVGRLVKKARFTERENIMDLSFLESGIYILKMTSKRKGQTIKIIKR